MNRESFMDTVNRQYADEIHEAYVECQTDHEKLSIRLNKLMSVAKVDGVSNKEFADLVKAIVPDAKFVFHGAKKAA